MTNIFKGCNSLISLPDISKWNTESVFYSSNMFFGCISLILIPDMPKLYP